MSTGKQYDRAYNLQAITRAKEIGQAKAQIELEIPKNTVYCWVRSIRLGKLDLGPRMQAPESAMTLNEELFQLHQKLKAQEKESRRLKKEKDFLEDASAFFAASRLKSAKNQRMKFILIKTQDGMLKGNIRFYCTILHITRQGFYKYLSVKDQPLVDDSSIRMYQVLSLKKPDDVHIPSESTVYRVMSKIPSCYCPA